MLLFFYCYIMTILIQDKMGVAKINNYLTLELYTARAIFISICSFWTLLKINNNKNQTTIRKIISYMLVIVASLILVVLKNKIDFAISNLLLVFMMSYIIFAILKENLGYAIIGTVISIATNYSIFLISIIMTFIINKILNMNNDFIYFGIMNLIHIAILIRVMKIKRFKHGISFLKKNNQNDYFDLLTLNISVSIVFFVIMISNRKEMLTSSAVWAMLLTMVIMINTIFKSLQLYYRQKLLNQELNKAKQNLANKTKEVEDLEAENISISKKSHTLAHKQKSLEHKIEEMTMKAEISKEEAAEVRDRLKEIGKDLYKEKAEMELDKTEIAEIDDMLKYMQSECKKNKIDFELQLKGNIHHMTNNLIEKKDLETLLADHIKNAIIAINHTDNINRSILVRLGKIDETYGLYIYDSGIEFKSETLENLGKKPSTTHKDEGGTGMGFMNTFDTLRKCNASLIIEEYNKPSKDNYTKAIIIKFDNKNEFKVESYRKN